MSREAMQMALEALEGNCTNPAADPEQAACEDAAITALRQALETEQEPVAWASSLDFDDDDIEIIPARAKGKLGTSNCDIPLFTAPPDYERGFVDGMQHQMKSSVDKAINKQPTKIFGPNLEEVLNSAGFYKKREWQGLTGDEARKFYEKYTDREELIHAIDKFLEEKNNG